VSGPLVGLVGCGEWGRLILRDLRALGCTVAVVARSEESAARARVGGAQAVVGDVAALPEVAGVVVAVPTAVHAQAIEAALPRGVPVFVEKPLCPGVEDARRLCAAAGDRVFVMDKWRYHPGVEALRDIARAGELGAVRGLRTTRVQWGNRHADVDAVWILAPHDLSIGQEILGGVPEPRAAVAEGTAARLEGMVALLGHEPWQVLEVSARHAQFRREVRLHCAEGVAVLDDGWADSLLVARGDGSRERRPLPAGLPLLRELRAFVEHLGGGPPPRSSAAEALAVVEAIARLRALAGYA
jgi:predicted dehydrogenase